MSTINDEGTPVAPKADHKPMFDLLEIVLETESGEEDDFVHVIGARTYNEEGEEVEPEEATAAVAGIHTCRDQGMDIYAALRTQVEANLKEAGVTYVTLDFAED